MNGRGKTRKSATEEAKPSIQDSMRPELEKLSDLTVGAALAKRLEILDIDLTLFEVELSREVGPFREAARAHERRGAVIIARIRAYLDTSLANPISQASNLKKLVNETLSIPQHFDEFVLTPLSRAASASEKAAFSQFRSAIKMVRSIRRRIFHLLPSVRAICPIDLQVRAVIQPYRETTEGQLVRAVALPWRMIIQRLKDDWTEAFSISPRQWEELIAGAFDKAGFDEVVLTPRSRDFGRDIIAVRNGVGSIRIIDSVKAYKPGNLVKYDDIRALAGVLHGDLKASKGILTTTSDFPPEINKDPILASLMPYRLELMNGTGLKAWLESLIE